VSCVYDFGAPRRCLGLFCVYWLPALYDGLRGANVQMYVHDRRMYADDGRTHADDRQMYVDD
jgi:hypothetical protein